MTIIAKRLNGTELKELIGNRAEEWQEQFPLSLTPEDMREYMTFLVAVDTEKENPLPCGNVFYEQREGYHYTSPDTVFIYMWETAINERKRGVARILVDEMITIYAEIECNTGMPVRRDSTGATPDGRTYLRPLFKRALRPA